MQINEISNSFVEQNVTRYSNDKTVTLKTFAMHALKNNLPNN